MPDDALLDVAELEDAHIEHVGLVVLEGALVGDRLAQVDVAAVAELAEELDVHVGVGAGAEHVGGAHGDRVLDV